jgi:hypothetical protein
MVPSAPAGLKRASGGSNEPFRNAWFAKSSPTYTHTESCEIRTVLNIQLFSLEKQLNLRRFFGTYVSIAGDRKYELRQNHTSECKSMLPAMLPDISTTSPRFNPY